ncbi:hypothetical protein HOLleu_34873 [Holothuria leucospilota]|uniref:Uncharacterized protein n=1 Tax=Holothuria leucospilota TaxID=206669 RepID=A0A9Q1BFP0_HOLLE|nr:hypothetical protein HOLleu_34873 [Holothuria leucospilota]
MLVSLGLLSTLLARKVTPRNFTSAGFANPQTTGQITFLTFLNLTPAQRWQHVKEHHGCFSCLKKAGRDHRMSNCRRKRACSEVVNGTQCVQFHHPLLHLPAGSVSGIVGVALDTKDEAQLPVVEVDIEVPRGMKQRGNILLDCGAQISLIRTSLAEQLNL